MAMTDKERILILLLNRIYTKALYGSPSQLKEWRDMQPGVFTDKNPLQPGDLVTSFTTIFPNEWMVGYVHEIIPGFVILREIGSNRLCKYGNERFLKIDKELLGHEILEGEQYQTYLKVCKAFRKQDYSYTFRFKDISFDGDTCTVEGRRCFSNETAFTFSFDYRKQKTIKAITAMINPAAKSLIENKED